MTEMEQRKVALILLNEQNGIAEEAYDLMLPYLDEDIKQEVAISRGRAYIANEDFAENALAELNVKDESIEAEGDYVEE
jgi:hypothetical protein